MQELLQFRIYERVLVGDGIGFGVVRKHEWACAIDGVVYHDQMCEPKASSVKYLLVRLHAKQVIYGCGSCRTTVFTVVLLRGNSVLHLAIVERRLLPLVGRVEGDKTCVRG